MQTIEVHNLTKHLYMGERVLEVLKGVAFSIETGEMVAITGASGSGKSTLMTLLGCLDHPTSGSCTIDGKETTTMSSDERAHLRNRKIGFVFQQFNLLKDLTEVRNVALPKLYAGMNEKQAQLEAIEQLKRVGLETRLHHYPYQLSGGQQQRVAIARSLANNPSLILADEPTGNLDSINTKESVD